LDYPCAIIRHNTKFGAKRIRNSTVSDPADVYRWPKLGSDTQ